MAAKKSSTKATKTRSTKRDSSSKTKPASSKGTAKKVASGGSYRAQDITVLEGLEPVRKRPGMYIGTTGPEGLHHLIWEVFDNARDEAMAGYANEVEITLLPNGSVRVADNGRGIPVDKHKQAGVSALEVIMTTLHAGGKFGGEGYKVSGGLHGVGVSVVNALSEYTRAEVHRDGGVYVQEYERGKRKKAVKKTGTSDMVGTIITFKPDREIFENTDFSWDKIVAHLRQQAYLVRGMRIRIIDARETKLAVTETKTGADKSFYVSELGEELKSTSFYFEGGLKSLVSHYNEHAKPVHSNVFYVEKEVPDPNDPNEMIVVEVALQYIDDISSRILAFANNTHNSEGGTHITGFKTALTRTLNGYAKNNNLLKEKEGAFTGDDGLEGLTAVVSVKLREIQFEGQTKGKLGSTEARSAVETAFGEAFSAFLEEHPNDARAIVNKVLLALRARKAAKAAKESVLRKGALEGAMLPGKLADCQTKFAEESELFIVEGDSAGGTAKTGRDRRTQAILPIRGKILNVERARLDRMLKSQEIKNLVVAFGTGIGDVFDIENLRYHKIVIATDADVDGAHIRTLLLTLFYRYFRPIIDGGYLYIAQPPLYKITEGKTDHFFYMEKEKDAFLKKRGVAVEEIKEVESEEREEEEIVEKKEAQKKGLSIQRYKGLGEMNSNELWETTMDPERRVLKQVTLEDAQEADKTFDTLMGSEVAPRKSFIQTNAKMATLDL